MQSSVLTREAAPLSGGTCGTYGAPTTISGSPAQTGSADTCYRYTLTGTDRVGNTSALTVVVRVDAPGAITTPGYNAQPGQINSGDQIVVTFDEAINLNTLCAGWTGSSLYGNNNGGIQLHLSNNAVNGNDAITLVPESGNPCFGANFGTFDLGSPDYTTTNQVYDGNGNGSVNQTRIEWNAANNQLIISVGAGLTTSYVASSVITWYPPPGLATVGGTPITTPIVSPNATQF